MSSFLSLYGRSSLSVSYPPLQALSLSSVLFFCPTLIHFFLPCFHDVIFTLRSSTIPCQIFSLRTSLNSFLHTYSSFLNYVSTLSLSCSAFSNSSSCFTPGSPYIPSCLFSQTPLHLMTLRRNRFISILLIYPFKSSTSIHLNFCTACISSFLLFPVYFPPSASPIHVSPFRHLPYRHLIISVPSCLSLNPSILPPIVLLSLFLCPSIPLQVTDRSFLHSPLTSLPIHTFFLTQTLLILSTNQPSLLEVFLVGALVAHSYPLSYSTFSPSILSSFRF